MDRQVIDLDQVSGNGQDWIRTVWDRRGCDVPALSGIRQSIRP
jgi:hypothetical protein